MIATAEEALKLCSADASVQAWYHHLEALMRTLSWMDCRVGSCAAFEPEI